MIKVPEGDALHAYKPLLPAVKTSQAHDSKYKITKVNLYKQIKCFLRKMFPIAT